MRSLLATVMFVSSLSLAWGQNGPAPAYGLDGGNLDEQIELPAVLSGDSVPALFSAEGERSNYLSGGLSFTTAYDDNILSSPTEQTGDTSFAVAPFISLNERRSRLSWQADYSPGFTFYRRLGERNQSDHNLGFGLEYRLSPHLTLKLKDAFLKTSNFLGGLSQNQQTPFGALQESNPTVITPVTDRLSNTGSGELTYQVGPNSVVGVRGLSNELHFPDDQQSGSLSDSHSQSGEAFLAHRISRIHWIGATYRFQRILTDLDGARSTTQALLFSYTLNITPAMSLSLFAGPQRSESSSRVTSPSTEWLPAAGGTFSWQSVHSAFTAGMTRRVTDGGGLPGAVQLTSVEASYRVQWARRWAARIGGSYGKNEIIQALSPSSSDYRSIVGLVAISHQIGAHLELEASYVRANQQSIEGNRVSSAFNRNRPQISLSYSFTRPLGR
jgi:hypothetical protein